MSSNLVIMGLCAATLGATAYLIATRPAHDDSRIADLERRLEAAEKRADASDALRADMGRIRERLDRAATRIEVPLPDAASAPGMTGMGAPAGTSKTPRAAAAPAEVESSTGPKPIEDVIAERVEKKVAEKMDQLAARDKERGPDGKWKAPIDELSKELGLTDAQKADAVKIFDGARDQGFVLLKTQRLDGGTILDDFAAALKTGVDPEEATKQFFTRLFTEKVPGSADTYLTSFMAITQDVHDRLQRQIGKDPVKRLDALRVDLLDVKTGYDPVGDYIRAKVQ